jgi:hypothetical protein
MAKDLKALEEEYSRLKKRFDVVLASLLNAIKANGVTLENEFIFPATDSVLNSIDNLEAAGGELPPQLVAFRRLTVARRKKIESLPPDVKVAIMRFSEIEGLFANVQSQLIHELHVNGVGIAALAKRVGINKNDVQSILDRPGDEKPQ